MRRSASGSARGVADLSPVEREFLVGRYLEPQPRVALAAAMTAYAHGGMDVSDGLVGDLTKMLRVSGASARVEVDRLPLSLPARAAIAADPDLMAVALTGGDDYEIIASIPPGNTAAFEAAAAAAGVPVACFGKALEGAEPPRFVAATAAPWPSPTAPTVTFEAPRMNSVNPMAIAAARRSGRSA